MALAITPRPSWHEALAPRLARTGPGALADRAISDLEHGSPLLRGAPELRDLARASSRALLVLLAELAAGTVPLDELELPPQATAFARELARRNVAPTELVRLYRDAEHLMWQLGSGEIHAAVEDPATALAVIEEFTDATLTATNELIDAVVACYEAERATWARSAGAVRLETVRAVLAGRPVEDAAASARLGYELRRAHHALCVSGEGAGELRLREVAAAIAGPRALVVTLAPQLVAAWCPDRPADVELPAGVQAGTGGPAEGVAGLRAAHREAREALRLAAATAARRPVAHADVALPALLTRDERAARRFAAAQLGALGEPGPGRAELRAAARAVLEAQGSPRRAARALGLHENTVAKRVRSAQALLGRPLAERPVELAAALVIHAVLLAEQDDAADA